MISKITSKFESKLTMPQRKIPPREVIITSKNGKDTISDVFINGIPRVSILEVLKDIFRRCFIN